MNFVVLIYDVSTEYKHHAKIRKLLCQYLHNVQHSCFQGLLSNRNLRHLKAKLAPYQRAGNSIIIYQVSAPKYVEIHNLGVEELESSHIIVGKQLEN